MIDEERCADEDEDNENDGDDTRPLKIKLAEKPQTLIGRIRFPLNF